MNKLSQASAGLSEQPYMYTELALSDAGKRQAFSRHSGSYEKLLRQKPSTRFEGRLTLAIRMRL